MASSMPTTFSSEADLKVFVTVGSTRFDNLVSSTALNASFLSSLTDACKGKLHVIAQYGNSDMGEMIAASTLARDSQALPSDRDTVPAGSAGTLNILLRSLAEDGALEGSLCGKDGITSKVTLFRFAESLSAFMEDADIVISHAGSGTILEVLRLPNSPTRKQRQLIAVPNTTLMDNHQAELADALANHPDGPFVHTADTSQISEKTADVARSMQLKPLLEPFPKFDGNHFRAIVDQEMGFL